MSHLSKFDCILYILSSGIWIRNSKTKTNFVENELWVAPEILRDDQAMISYQSADIYSFAVIISEIINGAKAYSGSYVTIEGRVQDVHRMSPHL